MAKKQGKDVLKDKDMKDVVCLPKFLPENLEKDGKERAAAENPANHLPLSEDILPPGMLAVVRTKYWGQQIRAMTVGFLDNPNAATRKLILEHMNAWSKTSGARFLESAMDPIIRIARERDGYWSYVGTDNLSIPRREATMNLEGFTERTDPKEYTRVVRHEAGHALGFPHEHMRRELVARLNRAKTIAWGRQELGWDEQTVIQQILTPLSEGSLLGTPNADQTSIMCYQLPGSITTDGKPVLGGDDINELDYQFIATIYPGTAAPPPPPPPPGGKVVQLVLRSEGVEVTFNASGYELRRTS